MECCFFINWFRVEYCCKMLLKEFYVRVVADEQTCLDFLREKMLLAPVDAHDPCHKCGTEMVEKRRKTRTGEWTPILRCPKKGCQTSRTVRDGNKFFHYTDLNGRANCKLTLCEILELVFMFIIELPARTVESLTNRAPNTVIDWFSMCREVCTAVLAEKGKMIGTPANPIQIDEARFAGKRKYNRGRMLAGDMDAESEDDDAVVVNRRNHGARIDGPWVFGLRLGNDCRYFVVARRDKATLIPIIKRECQAGSTIHSDEWPAYHCLTNEGFDHETVNHQENYVDPGTGAHTQAIERSWLDAKIKIMRKQRGVPLHMLQSHLDYYCWQMLRKDAPDPFTAFLEDIRTTYT